MLRHLILAAAIAAAPAAAFAGDLTPEAAREVTDQIIAGMDTYIDPAVAARVQASLRAHREDYAGLGSREAFAAAVSKDLYAASHDGHLKVSLKTLEATRAAALTPEQEELADQRAAYGLSTVRRLPGNIGYLKLSYLENGEAGARLVDTALGLLRHTDALIIDLRENRGGGGRADEEIIGHLAGKPIPMARITWRNPDGTTTVDQREAARPAGGPLYPDRPVFVLVSHKTFSAAEELVYDLKASGRAVIVGETTGGGANPANRPVPLGYGLRVFIPNGHVEHPLTHANWEGAGIAPDVPVSVDQALVEAYGRALKAARPLVATPASEKERAAAIADPRAALIADQSL
ncbi:S41 family peptidase [Phenylobacterium soli]|uniref:Tail specific protease domain-containing protein n=1 Tax=Phenylobacterium soli TaxID=2170551 RepID=A0A328AMR8_9CAUL|nr:S41 family peptidase [Phenylobacterium soli]RAK55266.1 hypothetical protein DJ017_12435 [Phenylobacterium soli]